MTEHNQGGFVYPFGEVNHSGPDKYPVHEGITLRQHYAGLAMQVMVASEYGCRVSADVWARDAFVVADAMILASEQ